MPHIIKFFVDTNQQRDVSFMSQVTTAYPMAVVMDLGTDSGDLLIELENKGKNKTILIEVKSSPNDFVASITDRRLFSQAAGMREITPWSFCLHPDFKYGANNRVVGVWTKDGKSKYGEHEHWSRNHIEGALLAVRARGAITYPNYRGVTTSIAAILNWAEDTDKGSVTSEKVVLSPFDKDDQQMVNLLCWFDGIGVKQAKNFIDWMKKENPEAGRLAIFMRAITEFDEDNKPVGWTNHTIERNRRQLKLEVPKKVLAEWSEEIDG